MSVIIVQLPQNGEMGVTGMPWLKSIQKLDYCIKAPVMNALSDCDLVILCISVYVPNYKIYSDLDWLMAS